MEEIIELTEVNVYFTYTRDEVLRGAGQNVLVFKGFFNGTTPIALKRYQLQDEEIKKQAEKDLLFLSSPDKRHENIIRYFGSAKKGEFLYWIRIIIEIDTAYGNNLILIIHYSAF